MQPSGLTAIRKAEEARAAVIEATDLRRKTAANLIDGEWLQARDYFRFIFWRHTGLRRDGRTVSA